MQAYKNSTFITNTTEINVEIKMFYNFNLKQDTFQYQRVSTRQ